MLATVVPLAVGVVYTRLGWTLVDRAVGDLCLNGKPEPSPFPQLRDLGGMMLGFTAAIASCFVAAAFVGPYTWPEPWAPLWFLNELPQWA